MPQIFKHKLYLIPLTVAILGVIVLFGLNSRANNDLRVGGTLWTQGLSFWENVINVEPGQVFKVSLYGANLSATNETFTNLNLSDQLPQYTSYVAGSAFQLDSNSAWQAYPDNGSTSPFIGGVAATPDGKLVPAQMANFKYSVKVADFLPNGTAQLSWAGPVLHFTDANGNQTNTNVEVNTINVQNLPNIASVDLGTTQGSYKLGDVINVTVVGAPGKTASLKIGAANINLTETASGTYTGSYAVQATDNFSAVPRAYLANPSGQGAYKDFNQNITIDGILPSAPIGLNALLNTDGTVKLIWVAPVDVSDTGSYYIYSNNGSGSVDFSAPLATTAVGTNQYTTAVLNNDALYKFVVRAVDFVGNTDGNTTTISKSTDVTPPEPPASLVAPTNLNSQVFQYNATTPVQFVWASSPAADLVKYRLEIDDNSDFSSIITSQDTVGTTTSYTLQTSTLNLADGIYYYRVSAIDDADLISTPQTNPSNSFEIDNAYPGGVVNFPSGSSFMRPSYTITGTASDAGAHLGGTNGMAKVEALLNDLTAGQYWNGTAWVGSPAFALATTSDNFSNWTYEFTAPIADGHTYIMGERFTDKAGNYKDTSLNTLTGDTSAPAISGITITNTTLSGTNIFKNGDGLVITATITDNHSQTSMTASNISANLSALTGPVPPNTPIPLIPAASYNPATGLATWNAVVAANAGDGAKDITIIASDIAGNNSTANGSIVADNTAPAITAATLTSPTGPNIYWAGGSVQNITWNQAQITDINLATNPITLEYTTDGTNYINIASNEANDGTYAWTVPSLNSQTVKIRVTARDIAGNTSSDISNNNFTIDSTAPAFSNAVLTNSTLNITTLVKNSDTVVLTATVTDNLLQSLLTTGSITANFTNITNNAGDSAVVPTSYNPATGAAVWNFKTTAGTGNGNLSLSITAADSAGNAATFTNTAIIVADNIAPAITAATLTAPSATNIFWAGGSTQNITWNQSQITDANLAANPILLEYTTDGANYTTIADNEANDGTYAWTVPSLNSQTVTVRVMVHDNARNYSNDISDNTFTIDSTPPTVPTNALTSPNGGEAWKQGTVRTITWNSGAITDNFALAANPIALSYIFNVSCSGGGGGFGCGGSSASIANNEANDGSFSWTTPTLDDTTVRVRITATDAAGNTTTDSSDNNFAIGLPPAIVQARAMSNTLIEVEWNKALANAGAFANYTATGLTPTGAAISGSNNKIVNLTVNALNNTGFTAADLAVALNTATDTSNFQNEAISTTTIADKQAPQFNLAGSYPNANQLIVDYSPGMRLAVSEAYGSTTVFKLDNVTQATAYDAANKLITFAPAATLAPGKHALSLDLVDMASNSIPNQAWDFYIDSFGMSLAATPVAFRYSGNLVDQTDAAHQQNITVSTFGAGYKIYAVFNPDFGDGFGNFITNVETKLAANPWTTSIALNRTTMVQLVSVAKPATPSASIVNSTYTFDLRATIPGVAQAPGNYNGTLQFIVVPEY